MQAVGITQSTNQLTTDVGDSSPQARRPFCPLIASSFLIASGT